MRKRITFLAAVSLYSGASLAQSKVTFYGVVDANVEYVNGLGNVPLPTNGYNPGGKHAVVRMNSGGLSGSRWGLRGEEDLGKGLTSLFVLESGFQVDTGKLESSSMFNRQAYVGLRSNSVGQLTFGRQYTSLFAGLANFMPAAYAVQYEPFVLVGGPNFRESNTIQYMAASGPLTVIAHWSFGAGLSLPPTSPAAPQTNVGGNGEVPGKIRADSAYGGSVMYLGEAFGMSLNYDQYSPSIGTGVGDNKLAAVAASYLFNGQKTKVMAGYRWGRSNDQFGNVLLRDDLFWAGLNYQVSASVGLIFEYNYEKVHSLNGSSSVANPWQLMFTANYEFSKRTQLYLTTAYARNAGLGLESSASGYAVSLALGNSYALSSGQKSMVGAALGIRHIF